MKLNITNKFKIWVVITLVVLVVGLVLYGVIGFNSSMDYKTTYEANIKVYSLDNSGELTQQATEKYFSDNGIDFNKNNFEMTEDGEGFAILKYQFKKAEDVEKINENNLKEAVKIKLQSIGLEVEEYSVLQVKKAFFGNMGYVALALGISIVAILVYLFFMEKIASALATIISGVISGLLFIAYMTIASIPVNPSVWIMDIVSVLITVVLSAGLVARFREEEKNSANAKLTPKAIADKAVDASVLRYVVVFAFLIVASVLLIAVGKGNYRNIGYELCSASIVSVFSSIVWTPIMWALLKKDAKSFVSRKNKAE